MKHILIVEDEPWLADVYEKVLQAAGFSTARTADAQAAIEATDDRLPDVILLDMMLPYGNGMQLLHELRSYPDTMRVPVVVCSSLADRLPIEQLQPYGVREVLDKSAIKPRAVVRAIIEALA